MTTTGNGAPPSTAIPRQRLFLPWLRLIGLVAALLCVNVAGTLLLRQAEGVLQPLYAEWGAPALVLALLIYVALLSIPFLPGIELGWAIMMVLGAPGVALVYAAALIALSLSYGVGRHVPPAALARLLTWLHLPRSAAWLRAIEPQSPKEQLGRLLQAAPARWIPFLVRHRYLALALLLNMPGNTIVGGGGGIAMLAGLSRVFAYPRFLLVVALAITPLPLVMLANDHLGHVGGLFWS
ncbi:MAG: hypothetical protein HY423_06470 [Candidatus Lambdaproteobacteria bacterium]|nr:hypothetical protein [Candidatus Lambdaproteobacteria bacterium]